MTESFWHGCIWAWSAGMPSDTRQLARVAWYKLYVKAAVYTLRMRGQTQRGEDVARCLAAETYRVSSCARVDCFHLHMLQGLAGDFEHGRRGRSCTPRRLSRAARMAQHDVRAWPPHEVRVVHEGMNEGMRDWSGDEAHRGDGHAGVF